MEFDLVTGDALLGRDYGILLVSFQVGEFFP